MIARACPELPEVELAPDGPCSATPMARAFPVEPDVAWTGTVLLPVGGVGQVPPPLPMCATAAADPWKPIAIAVGRPTSPMVQVALTAPVGLAIVAWAVPPSETAIARVHHSELFAVGAQVDPFGTYALASTDTVGGGPQNKAGQGTMPRLAAAGPRLFRTVLSKLEAATERNARFTATLPRDNSCPIAVPPAGTPESPDVAIAAAGP